MRLETAPLSVKLADPDGQAFECVSVAPHGALLLSRSRQTARLWDLATGQQLQSHPLLGPDAERRCDDVHWHPEGEALLTQSTLWRTKQRTLLDFGVEPDDSGGAGLSDTGNLYWTRSTSGFSVRDVKTNAELASLPGGYSLELDAGERYAALSTNHDEDPATELWSLRPLKRLWRREQFQFVRFAPDGEHFAAEERNWASRRRAGLFRSLDGRAFVSWEPANTACSGGLGWSSDSKRYAWLDDEHIYAVDVEKRRKQAFTPLEAELCSLAGIVVDSSGERFATSQRLFGFSPPRALGQFSRECASCELRPDIPPVSFSSDGQWLLSLVKAVPPETGVFKTTPFRAEPVRKLAGNGSWIPNTLLVALTDPSDPDGLQVVRASDGSWVRLSVELPTPAILRLMLESQLP